MGTIARRCRLDLPRPVSAISGATRQPDAIAAIASRQTISRFWSPLEIRRGGGAGRSTEDRIDRVPTSRTRCRAQQSERGQAASHRRQRGRKRGERPTWGRLLTQAPLRKSRSRRRPAGLIPRAAGAPRIGQWRCTEERPADPRQPVKRLRRAISGQALDAARPGPAPGAALPDAAPTLRAPPRAAKHHEVMSARNKFSARRNAGDESRGRRSRPARFRSFTDPSASRA